MNHRIHSAKAHAPRCAPARNRVGRCSVVWMVVCCVLALPVSPALAGEQTSVGTVDVVQGTGAVTVNEDLQTTLGSQGKVIYEWDGIQQPAGHTLEFDQSGPDAAALNRATGQNPFEFFGTVKSNGKVIFANEAGVHFRDGSSVLVFDLIAAAGDMTDGDFLSDTMRFTGLDGSVTNEGTISGLRVALLGERVANHGDIYVDDGQILMLAGDAVLIREHDSPIVIKVPFDSHVSGARADDFVVENTGHIDAGRFGSVRLAAADGLAYAIRNRVVERIANSGSGGEPALSGVIRAGEIVIAGGEGSRVEVGGRLDATRDGKHQTGGQIDVFGERILVAEGAVLDASGAEGGGRIRVGADRHGSGNAPEVALVVVHETAEIHADATLAGDGGEVIIWSDGHAYVHGEVTARGGEFGGDGGFVETSGRAYVDLPRPADVSARSNRSVDTGGEWLIDPYDVLIGVFPNCQAFEYCLDDGIDLDDLFFVNNPVLFALGQPSLLNTSVLVDALNKGSSITVTTSSGTEDPGEASGDITVLSDILPGVDAAENTAVALVLRAANHIIVEADIRTADDTENLNLAVQLIANDGFTQAEAPDPEDGTPNRFVGDVRVNPGVRIETNRSNVLLQGTNIYLDPGASITTDGGDVVIAAVGSIAPDGVPRGGGDAFLEGDIDTSNSLFDEQGEELIGGTLQVQARFGDVPQANAPEQTVRTTGGSILVSGDVDLGKHANETALTLDSLGGDIDIESSIDTGGGDVSILAVRVIDNLPPDEEPADVGGRVTLHGAGEIVTDGGDVTIEALSRFGGFDRSRDFANELHIRGIIDTTVDDDDRDSDGRVDTLGGNVILRADGLSASDPSGRVTVIDDSATPGVEARIATGGGDVEINFDVDTNGDGLPDGRSLASILIAGRIDAGLEEPDAELDIALENATFGIVAIDAAGTLDIENRSNDANNPIVIRGEQVGLRSANQSAIPGTRRADLTFLSNTSGEGPEIHADGMELRAGVDSIASLSESQSRVVLGQVQLRDTEGGAEIERLGFAQNATVTSADIPDPTIQFDQTSPGATIDGLIYLIQSMVGSVELDDPSLLTGSGGAGEGAMLELIANDDIVLGGPLSGWAGTNFEKLDLLTNTGFSIDSTLAANISASTHNLTITAGRLLRNDSDLIIEDGVDLVASDGLLLHAAAAGGSGDLIFGTGEGVPGVVLLESKEITLWAGSGAGARVDLSATNRVIAGSDANAEVRFNVLGGVEPHDRGFSLIQEATIADGDIPEISQFGEVGEIGLIDYELRSNSGDLDLGPEAAAKLARTDLRLLAWGDILLNDSLDVGELAATFEVRSLDIGRTVAFQVTQALLDSFAFAAPTGFTTDAALTLRSGVAEVGALTFDVDGVTVTGDEIRLVAGDGTGGDGFGDGSTASGDASAIIIGEATRFQGWEPDDMAPMPDLKVEKFAFHQDANIQIIIRETEVISLLPDIETNFSGRAPGTYAVQSDDGTVQIILDLLDADDEVFDFELRLPLATDFTILSAENVTLSRLDGEDLVLDSVLAADGFTERLEVRSFDALFGAVDADLDGLQPDGVTPNPLPDDQALLARVVTAADDGDGMGLSQKGLSLFGFAGRELADRTGDPIPEPIDLEPQTYDGTDGNVSIPSLLGIEQDASIESSELLSLDRIGNGCGLGRGANCEESRLRTQYRLTSRHADVSISPDKIFGGNLVIELIQALQDDPVKSSRTFHFDDDPDLVGPAARTFFFESLDAKTPYAWRIDADTTLQAADFVELQAGASGRGDLGFATGVTIQSEDIRLAAFGPNGHSGSAATLPIVDARTGAPTFDFKQPDDTDRADSNDDRLTIVQDGYINDKDIDRVGESNPRTLPAKSQITRAGEGVDPEGRLFAYTLESNRRGIYIDDLQEVTAQRLLMFANFDEVYDTDDETVDRPGVITINHATATDPDIDFEAAGIDRAALIGDRIELIAGPGGRVDATGGAGKFSIFYSDNGGENSPLLAFLIAQDQAFSDADNQENLPAFFQFSSGLTGVEYTLRLDDPGAPTFQTIEIGSETAQKVRGTTLTLEAVDNVKIDVPITLLEGLVLTSLDVVQADWVAEATALVIEIGDVLDMSGDPTSQTEASTKIETLGDQLYDGTVEITGNVELLGRDITFADDVLNSSTAATDYSSLDVVTRGTVGFGGQVGCDVADAASCIIEPDDWAGSASIADRWFDSIRVLFDADDPAHDAVAFTGGSEPGGPDNSVQNVFARELAIFAVEPTADPEFGDDIDPVLQIPLVASIYKLDPEYTGPGTGNPNAALNVYTESGFSMGVGQKLAAQGKVGLYSRDLLQVGDMAALEILLDVSDTGSIEVQRRPESSYLSPDGVLLRDAGISFVANTIDFAGTTRYIGSGRDPSFAIEDPTNPPDSISQFTLTAINVEGTALEKGDFEWSFDDAPDALPALHASGPPRNDISEIFVGPEVAPTPRPWMPDEWRVGDPRRLRDLAVRPRERTEAEWRRRLSGAGIIDEIGRDSARADGLVTANQARLLAHDAEKTIRLHEQVFGVDSVRAPWVRAQLTDALEKYQRSSGTRRVVGFEFRRYVKNRPSSLFEAYQIFEGLDSLFDHHRALGLTPGEYRPIQKEWLSEIQPEGISLEELAEAVHPSRYVRGTDILDIFGD